MNIYLSLPRTTPVQKTQSSLLFSIRAGHPSLPLCFSHPGTFKETSSTVGPTLGFTPALLRPWPLLQEFAALSLSKPRPVLLLFTVPAGSLLTALRMSEFPGAMDVGIS